MTTLNDFLATATADNVQAVADAKEYPVIFDSLKATAGRLKGVLGETPDPDFGTKWLQAKALASGSAKASDYYTLPDGITNEAIRTIFDMALDEIAKTDGYVELDPKDPMGPKNRTSIAILVLCGVWDQTLADKVLTLGQRETFPLVNTTLADVLAIRTPGTEQEAAYPGGAPYIICIADQGIDLFVTLDAPAPTPLRLTVYMAVCPDGADHALLDSFIRYPQPVGYIDVKEGETKAVLSLGSRKARGYNRLFVLPDFAASMTVICQTNRG